MRKVIFYFIILGITIVNIYSSFADEISKLPNFNSKDRIMVFAPHPDDETLGAGGILQEAKRLNIPVRVVFYTNGDNNELAFIIYEKRLVFKKKAFLSLGELRREEVISAMKLIGIDDNDLIFLGYPDFGTMHIFAKYWGDAPAFRSMFTRVDYVPYPECFSFGAPYTGESILQDIEAVLLDFMPTKIFVTMPVETNGDHRSLYLFLRVALWNLEGRIPAPKIFPYVIHVIGWPEPRGFHPELELLPPKRLINTDIRWFRFDLTDDLIRIKKDMISCFKSEIECNPPYLYTFARKNELFGDYPEIEIKENKNLVIRWDYFQSSINIPDTQKNTGEKNIESVAYTKKDGFLYIRIKLRKLMSKTRGIELYLFGYRKDIAFGRMPKIRIHLGWKNSLTIFDKMSQIAVDGSKYYYENNSLIIKFPLSALGNPSSIISCARTAAKFLPLDQTAWRILKITDWDALENKEFNRSAKEVK